MNGIELSYRKSTPVKTKFRSTFPGISIPEEAKLSVNGYKGGLFLEDNLKLSDRLIIDLGIRYQWYLAQGKEYHSVEPRLNVGYSMADNAVLVASYSRTSQGIHGLAGSYDGLPIQGWVNSSSSIPIQRADLFSTGVGYQSKLFDIRLDGYYRILYNQLDFTQGTSLLTGLRTNYDEIVELGGKGWAYGLESSINKKFGRLNYILSYTLSWNQRQFDNISLGRRYFHQYDQRHNLSLFLNWKISNSWEFSSLFQYNTGRRQTLPVASFPSPDGSIDYFFSPERNRYKQPDYHRMDLSITRYWKSRKRGRNKSFTFSIYNVHFRKNVGFYKFKESSEYDINGDFIRQNVSLRQVSILPILPSFTYSIDMTKNTE